MPDQEKEWFVSSCLIWFMCIQHRRVPAPSHPVCMRGVACENNRPSNPVLCTPYCTLYYESGVNPRDGPRTPFALYSPSHVAVALCRGVETRWHGCWWADPHGLCGGSSVATAPQPRHVLDARLHLLRLVVLGTFVHSLLVCARVWLRYMRGRGHAYTGSACRACLRSTLLPATGVVSPSHAATQ